MAYGWQNGIDKIPRVVANFTPEWRKTALLIIDMQEATGRPDSPLGKYIQETHPAMHAYYFNRLSQTVVPNQIKLLTLFRNYGLRIIYLALGSMLPDMSDSTPLRRRRQTVAGKRWVGSPAYAILDDVRPLEGELVLNKTAANAFNSSTIDQTLRNFGIECLVVVGAISFGCVLLTACDAADRGYKTLIVEDAVAGWDQDHHDAALRIFDTIYGNVVTTDYVREQVGLELATRVAV